MVNAQKHRELVNDWPTRARKKIVRQQLKSNNARKMATNGDKKLYSNGGVTGKRSIVETNQKRDKANNEFIQQVFGKNRRV